jgi:hypothetical protein
MELIVTSRSGPLTETFRSGADGVDVHRRPAAQEGPDVDSISQAFHGRQSTDSDRDAARAGDSMTTRHISVVPPDAARPAIRRDVA